MGFKFNPFTGNLDEAGEASGTVPVKATGAEVNTGTNDDKFATPKALADSDYAKTSDITAAAVGLGNVNNTSDANKPVSTAQQTALDLKANDNAVAKLTGDQTIAGVKTFSSDPLIPDEAYGVGWNGSLEPPTKNAVYDKVETLGSGISNSAGVGVGVVTADVDGNLAANKVTLTQPAAGSTLTIADGKTLATNGSLTFGTRTQVFTDPATDNAAADVMFSQSTASTKIALLLSDKGGNGGAIFGIDRSDGAILHRWGRTNYDIYESGNIYLRMNTALPAFQLISSGLITFSSSATTPTTPDVTISRNAAGITQFGTTAANANGHFAATSGILQPLTVATLPTAVAGRYAYVTDGDALLIWGATVINSGGGATKYLVWYNGTNWTVVGK